MRMGTTARRIERTNMGSGIAPDEGPAFIGKCDYCGQEIFSDMEHWELPHGGLYCSTDCLIYALDDYHIMGEID